MNSTRRHPLTIAAVAAAVVAIIGTFLPYFTLGPFTRSGLDTDDGKLALVIAIIGLLAFVLARGKLWGLIIQFVMAALLAVVAYVDFADIRDTELAEVGSGLWLIMIAAVAWTVISIALLVMRRKIWPVTAPAPAESVSPPQE